MDALVKAAQLRQRPRDLAIFLILRIPLPTAVMHHLDRYVTQYLPTEVDDIKLDTPLFWSTFGQRRQGLVRRPIKGKNVWRADALGTAGLVRAPRRERAARELRRTPASGQHGPRWRRLRRTPAAHRPAPLRLRALRVDPGRDARG
jgi:hypothetical protein